MIYPELPVIDPNVEKVFVARSLPAVQGDATQALRYVRTGSSTRALGLSLTDLLDATDAELHRLSDTGAPVIAHEWCYFPREALFHDTSMPPMDKNRVFNTFGYLEDILPAEHALVARVDRIDHVESTERRSDSVVVKWWREYRNSRRKAAGLHLSDDINGIHSQTIQGLNLRNRRAARWFVDIEPILAPNSEL